MNKRLTAPKKVLQTELGENSVVITDRMILESDIIVLAFKSEEIFRLKVEFQAEKNGDWINWHSGGAAPSGALYFIGLGTYSMRISISDYTQPVTVWCWGLKNKVSF